MSKKAIIRQMARETGLSIEEAKKALKGLKDKGIVGSGGKGFPFSIDMDRVAEIAKGCKNGNR